MLCVISAAETFIAAIWLTKDEAFLVAVEAQLLSSRGRRRSGRRFIRLIL